MFVKFFLIFFLYSRPVYGKVSQMRNGHIQTIQVQKINDIDDVKLLREIAKTAKRVVIATENEKAVTGTIYADVYVTHRDMNIARLQTLLQGIL